MRAPGTWILALALAAAGPAAAGGEPGSPAGPAGASAAGPTSSEAQGCAEAVADRVQAHYEDVRDLAARFEQTSRSVAFGSAATADPPARGRVVFAKPGRMRWSYEEPEPSLVVSDGETLWIYDPAAGEAQALPVDEGFLSGTAIQFLLGEGQLTETFRVSAESCAERPVVLDLVPRRDATYERLRLWVDPASGAVAATEVVDLFGNRTHVAFADVQVNRDPAPDLFRFEPPQGVEVMRLESP